MSRLIHVLFSRYGEDVRICSATGQRPGRALLRPVRSEALKSIRRTFSPLGELSRGRYVCLLLSDSPAQPEDTLILSEGEYVLRQAEQVAPLVQGVCQWCLCVRKGVTGHDQ